MRKYLIAFLMLFAVSADAPQKVQAGAFATEITQLLNHAQLVLAYIRQGLQLDNEIQMYANMLRNTKNIPNQRFGAIQADINALAQIVQGGQALAYSLGNLDQLFRTSFPDHPEIRLSLEIKFNSISSNYLRMGTALRRGRMFDEADQTSGAPVALINETMAQRFWPGEDPIDKNIRIQGPQGGAFRIVGVVQNALKPAEIRERSPSRFARNSFR